MRSSAGRAAVLGDLFQPVPTRHAAAHDILGVRQGAQAHAGADMLMVWRACTQCRLRNHYDEAQVSMRHPPATLRVSVSASDAPALLPASAPDGMCGTRTTPDVDAAAC